MRTIDSPIYYQYDFSYRSRLATNKTLILQHIQQSDTDDLARLLNRYGCSLGKKLLWLLDYFAAYDMKRSFHDTRGVEMFCSLDRMVSGAGGSKETWRKAIITLCVLGLLHQFRPRQSEPYIGLNTPAQDYSVARIKGKKRRPVTWYRVPEYTDEVLALATERASIVLRLGAGIDKDSIRYELGALEANSICDTGYPKSPWRTEMELALQQAILAQVEERGYTTLSDALEAAQRRTGRDRSDLEATWKSYRQELYNQSGIQYGRPKAQQKTAFNLESGKWIITQNKTLGEGARNAS